VHRLCPTLDFLRKSRNPSSSTGSTFGKIFIGAFLVGFLALNWVKSIRKATKAQIESERHKLAAQQSEQKAEYHTAVAELKSQLTSDKYELQHQLMQSQQA
jgi:hypothetical protein